MGSAEAFDELRPLLFAIAYRMLGRVTEAEDIVQEAFLRYHRVMSAEGPREPGRAGRSGGPARPESTKAYLSAVTTRLCIDHARSARVRREKYVGQWLPEPVLTDMAAPGAASWAQTDPASLAEQSDSLSMAFLLLLERLSPVERAVFLLHDVFNYSYDEVADIVGRSEDACRQLGYRARKHVAAGQRRFEASRSKSNELAERFFTAMAAGDLDGLVSMLAADAVVVGDAGKTRPAWPRPIVGRDKIGKLFATLGAQLDQVGGTIRPTGVNGQPGALFVAGDGRLISVMVLEIADDSVIGVRSIINRDKLRHLGPLADLPELRGQAREAGPEHGTTPR
ncbi:MAG: RNA polymerase sigma factor SigJ [Nocardiopsaceae bacterium]|jgi:RNA polymerase sigma-70 factor (ECF subfamily)|nr:RNA polymerase sigma factor SigJ [Nocardiopsaceae bacterium]